MMPSRYRLARTQTGRLRTSVRELLAWESDVHAQDEGGWTPLHFASREGHLAVVRELVGRGAKLEVKSKSGNTSLHSASFHGRLDVMRFLLDAGAVFLAVQPLALAGLWYPGGAARHLGRCRPTNDLHQTGAGIGAVSLLLADTLGGDDQVPALGQLSAAQPDLARHSGEP